ncbi:MAG: hypothetical protein PHF92_09100, partial [Bacteroidales bacterium]|nr:hypothetical protein [Bacteroidales bacterium]
TTAYNQPPHLSFYLPDYIEYLTGLPVLPGSGDDSNAWFDDDFPGDASSQSAKQVVSISFYNLLGQAIAEPGHGLYIRECLHSDGSLSRQKCYKP